MPEPKFTVPFIRRDGRGNYFVSDYHGTLGRVTREGRKELTVHSELFNSGPLDDFMNALKHEGQAPGYDRIAPLGVQGIVYLWRTFPC